MRHRHDDRRVDAWEDHVAALGTAHHALVFVVDELFSAAAAIARAAIPRAQMPRAHGGVGKLLRLFRAEKADAPIGIALDRALFLVKKQVILPPVEFKKVGKRLVRLRKHRAHGKFQSVLVDAAEKILPAELHHGAALFRHGVLLPLIKKVLWLNVLDHVGFPPGRCFFRRDIVQRPAAFCKIPYS